MIHVNINALSKFMEQDQQPQQVNIRNCNTIATIIGSVLISAVLVGFGMYLLPSKLTPIINPPDQDTSKGEPSKSLNNNYIVSSKIISGDGDPLETLNLSFDGQRVFLIRSTKKGQTKIELKLIGDYIRGILKSIEQPSDTYPAITPEISLLDYGDDMVLIEILEGISGDTSTSERTLFVINTNTKVERKLYVIKGWYSREGEDSYKMTIFDKHDLVLNCDEAEIEPKPSYRSIYLSKCKNIYLVINYSKQVGVYHQNPGEELSEELITQAISRDIGSVYYDKTGKIIEPEHLITNLEQKVTIDTAINDLMLGKISISINSGEKDYQSFDFSLKP